MSAVVDSDLKQLTDARIRVICESESTTKAWQQFAASCSADVDELLDRTAEPTRTLKIHFGETPMPLSQRPEPFSLRFAPDCSMEVVTHTLIRALLQRRFTDPQDKNPPVMPSADWLAAALTNRVLFGNRERYGRSVPDYEAARFSFQRGCFPEVARLLENPVPCTATVPYRLYALHCDLLARCVRDATDAAGFDRLLQLDARGRRPLEALAFVLQDGLRPDDTVQSWYARTVVDTSRRGRRPSDTNTTAERFEALVTVSVVSPGDRDFRGSHKPIDELPEKISALQLDKEALGRLQSDLFELLKDAPFLLQRPIGLWIDACRELAEGHTRPARSGFRKARKEFATVLEQQRRIDAYLDEQERRFVPAERRFALPADVVHRYALADRELDPALQHYLDTVSR